MAARVPPELWTHIFSFLDHRSLLRSVVPVCREFRDIGLSANLWKRLCAKMWVLQDNAPRDNNYTRYYFDKLKWEEEWLRGSARCFTHGVSDLPVTGLRLLDGKLFLSSGDFQVSVYFRTISQLHVPITAISTYFFLQLFKKKHQVYVLDASSPPDILPVLQMLRGHTKKIRTIDAYFLDSSSSLSHVSHIVSAAADEIRLWDWEEGKCKLIISDISARSVSCLSLSLSLSWFTFVAWSHAFSESIAYHSRASTLWPLRNGISLSTTLGEGKRFPVHVLLFAIESPSPFFFLFILFCCEFVQSFSRHRCADGTHERRLESARLWHHSHLRLT